MSDGSCLDIDDALREARIEGEDEAEALEQAIEEARKAGYRFVEYWLPNADITKPSLVRVSTLAA